MKTVSCEAPKHLYINMAYIIFWGKLSVKGIEVVDETS